MIQGGDFTAGNVCASLPLPLFLLPPPSLPLSLSVIKNVISQVTGSLPPSFPPSMCDTKCDITVGTILMFLQIGVIFWWVMAVLFVIYRVLEESASMVLHLKMRALLVSLC